MTAHTVPDVGAANVGPESSGEAPNDVEGEGSVALEWRVKLLRALTTGDLKWTQRILEERVDALSAPFTREMPAWSLEWESLHWWMLQSASALFVASCYSQPRIVEWLLQRGADREVACYLKQTALQVVGECCENAPTACGGGSTDRHGLAAASAECRRLLESPASLPSPPPVSSVVFTSELATELVRVAAPSSSAASPTRVATASATSREGAACSRSGNARADTGPRYVQQKVYSCVVTLTWDTPDANGAVIDKYELRYRLASVPSTAASDSPGRQESKSSEAEAGGGWRMERATHNRKARMQRMVLTGSLQFNTPYECALRSWNAAGKGEWGASFTVQTTASPE